MEVTGGGREKAETLKWLSTLDARLSTSLLAKSFFGTTTERREKILNHGLYELTRMGREAQGYAWASQAAMDFQIPSQASSRGIMKTHRSFCYANGPALAPRSEIFWKKHGVAIGLQAGMCCGKSIRKPA